MSKRNISKERWYAPKHARFGWLAPSGRFIECDMYEHIETVAADDEMKAIPKVAEMLKELKDLHDEYSERNSCAEWHTYEWNADQIRPKIIKAILRAKFLRVGASDDTLYFEGYPDVIKSRKQECEDFAEGFGMQCKLEPRR